MRKPIIAGNWKMNKTIGETQAFFNAFTDALTQRFSNKPETMKQAGFPELILSPSYISLYTLVNQAKSWTTLQIAIAAQNMSAYSHGAYTGEVSALMLQDIGVNTVILGHSERRQYFNESDDAVAEKTLFAFEQGIVPIVCVGETLEERESGNTDQVVIRQINAVLSAVAAKADLNHPDKLCNLVIAYEPVWAIGTGKVCDAAEANRVCALIRSQFDSGVAERLRILYGGSVKASNADELFAQPDIDGALVGGASLEADSFIAIVSAAFQQEPVVA
ncbi:MAG: triose-phosphate isomerase [Cyanobacteria bacterium P01_H01_bin.74]